MMRLFLGLLFTTTALAQDAAVPRNAEEQRAKYNEAEDIRRGDRERLLKDFDPDKIDAEELNDFPEIYLRRQTMIQNRSNRTGIYREPIFTQVDNSRISLGYGLSQDYQNPTKVQSVYANYMNKIDDFYQEMWWTLQFKRTQAQFDAIHTDPESGGRNDNLQGITIIGTGVAHNFHALSDIFESSRLFENIAVYFNYNFHIDSTDDERYTGFGYTADYSLAYRSQNRIFYGGKFSYNWAMVERPEVDDEPLLSRSLTFGWTSLSFEIGFYY